MQNGFIRSSKYFARCFIISIGQIAIICCVTFLYTILLNTSISGGIVPAIVAFTPLVMSTNVYTLLYKNTVGFSITRFNFFASSYVGKLFFTIGSIILMLIFLSFSNLSLPIMFYFNLFFLSICFGILGDFFGIIIHRFSTIGFVIYIISCATFGGLIGFSAVFFKDADTWNIISNPIVLITTLVVITVFTSINWLVVRNLEINN